MRLQNWESILAAEIEAGRKKQFAWGEHDCVHWALRTVTAITGTDYTQYITHRYSTAFGAGRAIKRMAPDLPSCFDLYFPRVGAAFARRGDLVFYCGAVGVCEGKTSFFAAEKGLSAIPTLQCNTAWRVD